MAVRSSRFRWDGASPIRRVLVATDFSLDGDRAARRAAALPLAPDATITVVHVLRRRFPRAAESLIRGSANQLLDATVRKIGRILDDRGFDRVTVKPRVARGNPAEELGTIAAAVDAEVTVVGRGGRTLGKALLGSTAERIVRTARRPVLLVRLDPRGPYRRVMIGYDFSPEAYRAASLLARVAGPQPEMVAVANVYEDPFQDVPPALIGPRLARQVPKGAAVIAHRAQLIRRTLPPLDVSGSSWRLVLKEGEPRRILDAVARQKQVELIAVGSVGRTGLRRLLMGSVAESILRHAATDVLIVPRRPGGAKLVY